MIEQQAAPVAADGEPAIAADAPARLPTGWLFAASAVVAVVRWWSSHRREMFHITPDEPGQLAIARFVGGMARWNMFDRSTWRPGYGTLIAPLHWLTDDPVVAFQLALGVNALLGGAACVLLCLLARRLTTLTGRGCVVAGTLVALAPAVVFATNWTWSEALVVVTYLGALLAALRFWDVPSIGRGVALALLAAAGFAAHSRLLPVAALVVVLVGVVVAQHRLRLLDGAAVIAVGALAMLAVARYSAWLVERIWETPTTTNSAEGVAGRLSAPGPIALSLAGQVWYQLVATAGLAGLGTIALVSAVRRRGRGTAGPPARGVARIVLVVSSALIALAVVFMSDRLRPDQIVYGRYNDAVVGPLVVVGVAALVTASRRFLAWSMAAVLVVLIATTVLVETWRAEALAEAGVVRAMVLGLAAFTGSDDIDVVAVARWAVIVVVVVTVVAIAARSIGRRWSFVAVLVPLLVVGFVRTSHVVEGAMNSWALPAGSVDRLRQALPSGEAVRFRVVPNRDDPAASWGDQRLRTMVYQFYLPTNAMTEETPDAAVSAGWVFGPVGDPDLADAGGEVRWRDPRYRIGLWLVPAGPPAG